MQAARIYSPSHLSFDEATGLHNISWQLLNTPTEFIQKPMWTGISSISSNK